MPSAVPSTPWIQPCQKNTRMMPPAEKPSDRSRPISRVFWTVTVISVLVMPKAATMVMKISRKNIMFFSSR